MKNAVLPCAVAAAVLFCVRAFAGGQPETVPITLEVSVPASASPVQSAFKDGAETYASLVGRVADVVFADSAAGKQLADIKAAVARTGGYAAFFVVFADPAGAASIAGTLEQAGVYWVSGGDKPPDLKAGDYPHWVAHIAYDGFAAGSFTADRLIKTLPNPGEGKILALAGLPGNASSAERWQGLQKVLTDNPGVQVLQPDAAPGDRAKAYDAVRALLASRHDVDGVWAENDETALGALQALKQAGLAGKVKVTGCGGDSEMLEAVTDRLAAATVILDQRYQAELSLAMALAAKQGKLDVASLPRKERMFEISGINVDTSNAARELEASRGARWYDLTSFFARWSVALD
ncbi:MAG TPA: sugar ABC transporter substrate-binding protein [Spirochaetia bacterium]|nr:sugar ABC transporter substrate-binding protein [Spirochaetia bacterium]